MWNICGTKGCGKMRKLFVEKILWENVWNIIGTNISGRLHMWNICGANIFGGICGKFVEECVEYYETSISGRLCGIFLKQNILEECVKYLWNKYLWENCDKYFGISINVKIL